MKYVSIFMGYFYGANLSIRSRLTSRYFLATLKHNSIHEIAKIQCVDPYGKLLKDRNVRWSTGGRVAYVTKKQQLVWFDLEELVQHLEQSNAKTSQQTIDMQKIIQLFSQRLLTYSHD